MAKEIYIIYGEPGAYFINASKKVIKIDLNLLNIPNKLLKKIDLKGLRLENIKIDWRTNPPNLVSGEFALGEYTVIVPFWYKVSLFGFEEGKIVRLISIQDTNFTAFPTGQLKNAWLHCITPLSWALYNVKVTPNGIEKIMQGHSYEFKRLQRKWPKAIGRPEKPRVIHINEGILQPNSVDYDLDNWRRIESVIFLESNIPGAVSHINLRLDYFDRAVKASPVLWAQRKAIGLSVGPHLNDIADEILIENASRIGFRAGWRVLEVDLERIDRPEAIMRIITESGKTIAVFDVRESDLTRR
jgi:hypothetical protein